MIVITGVGGSGTSFVAELYAALGFDVGRGKGVIFQGKTGGEDELIYVINECLLAGDAIPPEVLHVVARRLEVAKHPSFLSALSHWLEAGAPIDHVIICLREMAHTIESFARRGFYAGPVDVRAETALRYERLGTLWETVMLRGIPFTPLPFPKIVTRQQALYNVLPFPRPVSFTEFALAFTEVARPSQIGV